MEKTKLILVGGFLGAGKTSMLQKAAAYLRGEGKDVGLITNDQASGLVDTAVLKNDGNIVYEVSGSCFCCNFPGFAEAVEQVAKDVKGGITLAEPVGSCTDLSATIMQPLKEQYKELADTAPLTVMADPERLKGILDGKKTTAAYIVTKQFDEADIILINKTDLLSEEEKNELTARTKERWPCAKVMTVSVKDGTGLKEWLETVLADQSCGGQLAEVDYDIYADGEAAYGWLNAVYQFQESEQDYAKLAEELLSVLGEKLRQADIEVGHVKFLLQNPEKQWIGNLTGGAAPAVLREEDCTADSVSLTVNARAETDPKQLQDIVLASVDQVFAKEICLGTEFKSLIPGRPNPTFRYDKVVE